MKNKRPQEGASCELADSAEPCKIPRVDEINGCNDEAVHDVFVDHWSVSKIQEMMKEAFRFETDKKTKKVQIRLCIVDLSTEWETILGPILEKFVGNSSFKYRKFSQSWLSVGKRRWILLGDLLGLKTDRIRRLSVKGDREGVIEELAGLTGLVSNERWKKQKHGYIDWILGCLVEELFPRAPYEPEDESSVVLGQGAEAMITEQSREDSVPTSTTKLYLHIEGRPMWRILLPLGKHQWNIAKIIWREDGELKYYHVKNISAPQCVLDTVIAKYVRDHKRELVTEFLHERTLREIAEEIEEEVSTDDLQEIADMHQTINVFPAELLTPSFVAAVCFQLRAMVLTTMDQPTTNLSPSESAPTGSGANRSTDPSPDMTAEPVVDPCCQGIKPRKQHSYFYATMREIIHSIESDDVQEIIQEMKRRNTQDLPEMIVFHENRAKTEETTWYKDRSKVWDTERAVAKRLYTPKEIDILQAIAEVYYGKSVVLL